MSGPNRQEMRARDDTRLRRLVSEARARMADEGIVEQPLDWDAVARQERALWWRDRLWQAIEELPGRVAHLPERLAEAAFQVTVDAAHRTAAILTEPASACQLPEVRLEFSYASVGERRRLGLAVENPQSMGVFLTSNIPGAQIVADVGRRTVTIKFLNAERQLLALLVPEDPSQTTLTARTSDAQGTRAVFENVADGAYLLALSAATLGSTTDLSEVDRLYARAVALHREFEMTPSTTKLPMLTDAIRDYETVLGVYTERDFPTEWATTQNNLGNAYRDIPVGDRGRNVERAIDCYQQALRVRTEQEFPVEWAATQSNLGAAYLALPTGDRGQNVERAIACYHLALRVYTEREFPVQWATTQNNLAKANRELLEGGGGGNV